MNRHKLVNPCAGKQRTARKGGLGGKDLEAEILEDADEPLQLLRSLVADRQQVVVALVTQPRVVSVVELPLMGVFEVLHERFNAEAFADVVANGFGCPV